MEEILKRIAVALEKIEAKMGVQAEASQPTLLPNQPDQPDQPDQPEKKVKKWKEWTGTEDKALLDCIVLGFGYEAIQANIFPNRTIGAVKYRYYTIKNKIK